MLTKSLPALLTGTFLLLLATPARGDPEPEPKPDWRADIGIRWFKHSAAKPNELGTHPVFDRWEGIQHDRANYSVREYQPLEPLYFFMNFGADILLRYHDNLMIKIGYDYSNPFGIGGKGHIAYTELGSGNEITEEKEFSYTIHQITTFVGPIVTVGEDRRADLYLGFSPMAPTWVRYHEHYKRTQNGVVTDDDDRTYKRFFGSCRALIGLQVRAAGRLKLGSEVVFAFLNYMELESGELKDRSFRFPAMKWNVTARYELF